MTVVLFLLAALAAETRSPFTSPKSPEPEQGYGLGAKQAESGWISLFDGKTAFGWKGADVRDGQLVGGATTSEFRDYALRIDAEAAGEVIVGTSGQALRVPAGESTHAVERLGRGPIKLGLGLAVRKIVLRPTEMRGLFVGGDAGGMPGKVIPHPSLPPERQAKWGPGDVGIGSARRPSWTAVHVVGGPGCLELPGSFGDFVLQGEIQTLRPLTNAGVFFRCRKGDFLNGYEAQVFNGCHDEDPAKPARYATGAIDDRQNARRLVSRDSRPFTLTVVANGPHVATWVNGYQVTDWTDERPENDNARQGRRLKPGPIQLQAHERTTNVVFQSFRIAPLDPDP